MYSVFYLAFLLSGREKQERAKGRAEREQESVIEKRGQNEIIKTEQ